MENVISQPVAVVVPSVVGGGAERVWLDLASALVERGHKVDLVILSLRGQYHSLIPTGITVFSKDSPRDNRCLRAALVARGQLRTVPVAGIHLLTSWLQFRENWPDSEKTMCTPELAWRAEFLRRYIECRNPRAMLSATTGANCPVIMARRRTKNKPFVCVSVHSNVALGYSAKDTKRARLLYPLANLVTGVSRGVTECANQHLALPKDCAKCIYNGIPNERIKHLSQDTTSVADKLLQSNKPILLSAMRLPRRPGDATKDHETLLKSFALVRNSVDAKLALIGVGQELASRRQYFLNLATNLGVINDIVLLGFHENPFPYMARANVLVHSSRREGLPTVLLEALACGTPVVSTDTPFGPAEILEGGRFGELVPVGEERRMAEAIISTLDGKHPSSDVLQGRAAEFSLSRMAENYEAYCMIRKA